ncbi:MAG TPA: hypothetical protein VMZ27_05805 [Candidatus Saccharimonadales bacterium]|nr:hypothetical protein [Candidatus Saccharimonadales bacterium]
MINIARPAAISLIILAGSFSRAQTGPRSGLYEIVSGRYTECCGIAGNDLGYDVPAPSQKFVRFTVDAQGSTASMTFLGDDVRTVFSRVPCPPSGPINFSFNYGFIFSNQTVFHVDPGPPPYQLFWNYTVSNAANNLTIGGVLGTARSSCADAPTRFGHSNVVAVLVSGPKLTLVEAAAKRPTRIMVQGRAGWTDVIEASTDLKSWTPVATNIMDFSLCPICPFATFDDAASTILPHRFYRAFELP